MMDIARLPLPDSNMHIGLLGAMNVTFRNISIAWVLNEYVAAKLMTLNGKVSGFAAECIYFPPTER